MGKVVIVDRRSYVNMSRGGDITLGIDPISEVGEEVTASGEV